MKIHWREIVISFAMSIILPAFIVLVMPGASKQQGSLPQATVGKDDEEITETTDIPLPSQKNISVLMENGRVCSMDMDTYLTGVLLMEMPAEFEIEALKAQAVVARTYALRRIQLGDKHAGGAVCTDSTCCQAYCAQSDYLSGGGTEQAVEKVRSAVTSTDDLVITYGGALIEATYFSCSGGKTEDAKAVWGSEIPYLQSVSSPGEEIAAHYTETVTFLAEEFVSLLGQTVTGYPETWLEEIIYTEGGGVDTIKLCGKTYKGTTFRTLLGLRSTAFTLTAVGNKIIITTKGYGHRVGMSQYGAEAMAVQGSTFEDILMHYYQQIQLEAYQWGKN